MMRLVDAGWGWELTDALRADTSELRLISPFIKAHPCSLAWEASGEVNGARLAGEMRAHIDRVPQRGVGAWRRLRYPADRAGALRLTWRAA